jgi:hypothetical protein
MIPIQNAINAVADFASKDIVALMPSGPMKFASQMAVYAAKANPEPVVKPYEAFLKMTGILSQDGQHVDEQALYNALMGAFKEMPSVTVLGFTFNSADAEKLMQRMLQ